MPIRICKRGHDYEVGKVCRECKRILDREHQRRKSKNRPPLTPEQIEARRRDGRERYERRKLDQEWVKMRSKQAYQAFKRRVTNNPEAMAKHEARMKARYEAMKADPERMAKERERVNESSRDYRARQYKRATPAKDVAARLLEKARIRAEQERMGVRYA